MFTTQKNPLRPESRQGRRLEILSGDHAVAAAAFDAGVRFASAYPGTPATDALEALERMADAEQPRCVWSVNEKVAYESALAAAVDGRRALTVMKHVGLNVAADAFVSSCYSGVNAGLVVMVADDPGCVSSQNAQDTRWYQRLSGTMLLEPFDSQTAYDMTRAAFPWSERFQAPIIIRLTTRTAHGCTPVVRAAADVHPKFQGWRREPERFLLVPSVARERQNRLLTANREMARVLGDSPFAFCRIVGGRSRRRRGVVAAGLGGVLAKEYVDEETGLLCLPGAPFPEERLAAFVRHHEEILVLEEGDPFWEERAAALAGGATTVRGRLSGDLTRTGELKPDEAAALVFGFSMPPKKKAVPDLPERLPEICKGCGYHHVFGALAQMPDVLTPGDIGCNTLGGLAPYKAMDANLAMGASLGLACGLAAAGRRRIVALIGDSTFFHGGMPPLVEAVRQGLHLTVLLLDNGTTAMTGGQEVPHGESRGVGRNKLDLEALVRSLGVTRCAVFNPHKLGCAGIRRILEATFDEPGVKVLIYRSPCLLFSPGYGNDAATS